jgi:hypothetical protein
VWVGVGFVLGDSRGEVGCDSDVELLEAVREDVDVGVFGHAAARVRPCGWNEKEKVRATAKEKANTGVLRCAQDDGDRSNSTGQKDKESQSKSNVNSKGNNNNSRGKGNSKGKYRGPSPSLRSGSG